MKLVAVVFCICTAALPVQDSRCRPIGTSPSGKVLQWISDNPDHPDHGAIETAFNHLVQYGYSKVKKQNMNWKVFCNALRKYQKTMEIPQTGEPDPATLAKMAEPRCANADEDGIGHNGRRIQKRYELHPNTWSQQHFTFKITAYTPDLTDVETRECLCQAFASWSCVTSLTFTPTTCSDVDIEVKFGPPNHGCGFPFPPNTLAHAFYPSSSLLGGDVHMNVNKTWTIVPFKNFNCRSVLLHELGHSLGVKHSYVSGAIMQAIYSGSMTLAQDDINAIQAKYGNAGTDWNPSDTPIDESCVDRSPGYPQLGATPCTCTQSTTPSTTSSTTSSTTTTTTTTTTTPSTTSRTSTPTPSTTSTTTTPTTTTSSGRNCCFFWWGFCWYYC